MAIGRFIPCSWIAREKGRLSEKGILPITGAP